MALAKVMTRAVIGVLAPKVMVEAHLSHGLPCFTLVGLPEKTVREARERVRSAIINSGYKFPVSRITISLAPADMPKEGGRYDLPIALAVLVASGQLPANRLDGYEFAGELSLSGKLKAFRGAIPSLLAALDNQCKMVIPAENEKDAGLIDSKHIFIAKNLVQVSDFLKGKMSLPVARKTKVVTDKQTVPNMQDVVGQHQARRAAELSAAGGHNLLLIGPPGTGKTMLAVRLQGLLPPLTLTESIESAAVYSISGAEKSPNNGLAPFRSPHHSTSRSALVGGGTVPLPGEISLAHHGILFLDELPEFSRQALDALRQPLENGSISLSRSGFRVCYPARFQLIAAMNTSPTGYHQGKHQRVSPLQTLRYINRISGPLLDRFDLSVDVPLLPAGSFSKGENHLAESSEDIARRVTLARKSQIGRQSKLNANLHFSELNKYCRLSLADKHWLEQALEHMGLSGRAWLRILRVARTIADLAGEPEIKRSMLQEALSYHAIDRLLSYLQQLLQLR